MLDPDRDVVHERHSGAVGVHPDGERAMRPSCDAVGQQALVWFEIRLPSPNTTNLPLILRIGWGMCTC